MLSGLVPVLTRKRSLKRRRAGPVLWSESNYLNFPDCCPIKAGLVGWKTWLELEISFWDLNSLLKGSLGPFASFVVVVVQDCGDASSREGEKR